MNTRNIVDMGKRPPHRTDVLANAVFGDQIPQLFREGKYYEKGNIVYTYDKHGNIDVWECRKSGVYGRPAQPSWTPWSMDEVRTRLENLEKYVGSNTDVFDVQDYDRSYLIHDVGVGDWEYRGSFVEVFNNKKYLAKKHYKIENEEILAVDGEVLPAEDNTTLYLNKAKNTIPNLIRRLEMYGNLGDDGRVKIPYPVPDMSLFSSHIFDLFVDGIYISDEFFNIEGESENEKYVVFDFSGDIPEQYEQAIEDEDLKVVYPVDKITKKSEIVFIFYISICHDLTLVKTDYNKFIGETKESKLIDISSLDFEEVYQEITIYNNGKRMSDKEYVISNDRINVDDPKCRFVIGSFATVSMKSFQVAEQDVVPNVKQETVPIFEENTKILAIPFLNFDNGEDRFLVFNDGGILLGSQKWFEDHGFINVYDDDAGLTPNDMVEFRMISRDKSMEIQVYTIPTTLDNQATYELPIRLKDAYFHMLFTENGEFISRSKYAVSGKLLQMRSQYATMLKGERLELLCFVYTGDYGFTAMTNYKSNWNPKYAEQIINTLPAEEDEEESGTDGGGTTGGSTGGGTDEPYKPAYPDYDLVENPLGVTLHFTPDEAPGTRCNLVQDTATNTLKSAITRSEVSYVIGVDCDNQIICTTYNGDIIRFSREGEEDNRYKLKEVSTNTIDMLDSDDFGNSYFHTYSTLNIGKIRRDGNKEWEFLAEECENPISFIRSIKYIDNYLYVEYAPYAITEYTVGKINALTGEFSTIPISIPEEDSVTVVPQQWCAKISHINRDHIYIGSNGHVIYEFEKNGMFIQKYTDLVEDFLSGNVIDVCCDGLDGNVYAIVQSPMDNHCQLIKYTQDGELVYVKNYSGEIKMTTDSDGFLYIFDAVGGSATLGANFTKIDKENGDDIWTYEFKDGITSLNSFFVDPVDYHVYGYYTNNNDYDIYRYVELEQNGLPIPKYRHEIVFNCDENVTTTDLLGSTVKEINALSSPTNRLYIGTKDGSVYTYTQAMREMSKGRTVKLWKEENPDNIKYIIPDDEYNFYVIKDNIIEKWNRYERKKWRYDGDGIMLSVMRQIALNPETKDLVFLYQDTDGRHSLGKLSTNGEFESLNITLPNGVKVEDADCSISCSQQGEYFFGYTGATVYRYSETFSYITTYGVNTAELLDGPAGNVVIDRDSKYVYVTARNKGDEKIDKLIKYNSGGSVVWEHDFFNGNTYGHLLIDDNNDLYVCDEREIRKVDEYGNYVWRFRFKKEEIIGKEPNHIVMDEFYRLFFVDEQGNLHRIDQYDLTLDPIPDEPYEPPEPVEPDTPDTPDKPEDYILVQRKFDIPFDLDQSTSAMLIFTNTGQYVGKRFYDINNKNQIVLKGSPIYEDGWLDIILIENVKESIIL